ncbi:MBL fold metallo-hydrolase [Aureitalea marina]|uniref:beta-lactamase n=1 Tax=Aureitalea marina TaxID=930804 RepID=A0A2S7KRA2_9FLAO|nr:MBL fold metallo-hydrolase [Aureitalea marina]PQB05140.1 hypothetical protein BST85_09760 [Aureitalea marina]
MNRIFKGLLLASIAALPLGAQENQPNEEIEVVKVRDSIYMLQGRGGNIGLSLGEDGIFMIDDKFASSTPNILNAILTLSNASVQFVINTHHHGDHTGGNINLRGQGATIFAHENVRSRLIQVARDKYKQDIEKSAEDAKERGIVDDKLEQRRESAMARIDEELDLDPHSLPMVTFGNNLHFYYNGEEIVVFHVARAHTDGDVMVYFTESNVLQTGDAYVKDAYPFIDSKNGGSLAGYIAGLSRVMSMIDEDTLIIPGHGDIATQADIRYTLSMLTFIRDRIAFHLVAGKSKQEIMAMSELTDQFDQKGFGDGFINTQRLLESVFPEIEKKFKGKN